MEHIGIIGHDHVMVSMAASHYSNQGIRQTRVLSINVVDEAMLKKADYTCSLIFCRGLGIRVGQTLRSPDLQKGVWVRGVVLYSPNKKQTPRLFSENLPVNIGNCDCCQMVHAQGVQVSVQIIHNTGHT